MTGAAIVFGSSANALSELEAALRIAPGSPVFCVNDSLRASPIRAHAFATLHPEKALRFLDGVDVEGLPLFTFEAQAYSKLPWTIVREKWAGSSGLYATQIALEEFGFSRVIVAGVPIDPQSGTAYRQAAHKGGIWGGDCGERYRRGWARAADKLAGRVRSMSGWTQELLGAPSPEWANGLSAVA